jgi:hypothetical protein
MAIKAIGSMIITDNILRLMDPRDRPKGNAGLTFGQCEAKRLARLEREEHGRFVNFLERNQIAYAHSRTDKRTTANLGVADFLIPCYRLAIEFKRPGGKLSAEQECWRRRHEARGGIYRVVCSYQEAVAITEALAEQ